jgi:poly(A) polymerase
MTTNAQGSRQWGLTPPLANTLPTDAEMRLNETLLAELRGQNNFETAEETEKRRKALAHFQKVTEEFVRHVSKSKGLNPSVVEASGGKVATFGSYRLGVYGPGKSQYLDMIWLEILT